MWNLITVLVMSIGNENPMDLNIQVLGDSVCTVLRPLLVQGRATILWEQVICSSVVPGHKVTLIWYLEFSHTGSTISSGRTTINNKLFVHILKS